IQLLRLLFDGVELLKACKGERCAIVAAFERPHEVTACVHVTSALNQVVACEALVKDARGVSYGVSLASRKELFRADVLVCLAASMSSRAVHVQRRLATEVAPHRPVPLAGSDLLVRLRISHEPWHPRAVQMPRSEERRVGHV